MSKLKAELTDEIKARALELYAEDWGVASIAIHLSVKHSPLYRFIKSQGVMRSQNEGRKRRNKKGATVRL